MNNHIKLAFDGAYCYIKKANTNLDIDSLIKQELSYEDKSLAYMSYKMGRTIDTKRTAFDKVKRRFPTGFLVRIWRLLENKGLVVDVDCLINPTECVNPELPDFLYEHQVKGINILLKNPRACLEAPTGSGKSYVITYLLKAFPQANILITVPSSTLLNKMVSDIESALEEEVGRVGGGKKEWKRVTVGIINSVINEAKDNPKQLEFIQVCIRDECHSSASSRHETLSNYLTNCYYSYGLSATIERADGKLILIEGAIGPTVLKIREEEVSSKSITLKPSFIQIPFKHRPTKYKGACDLGSGTFTYRTPNNKPDVGDVYKKAIESNPERDRLVIDVLKLLLASPLRKGGILLLVKGIQHGKNLSKLSQQEGISLPFLSGASKLEQRQEYLDLLRNRELDCLCSTSIFNEGEDIKPLEFVLNAGAGSNKRILTQQIGRVTRSCEGKKWALFIDILDEEPFYLTTHSNKRERIIVERYQTQVKKLNLNQLQEFLN